MIACVYTEYVDKEVVIEAAKRDGDAITITCKTLSAAPPVSPTTARAEPHQRMRRLDAFTQGKWRWQTIFFTPDSFAAIKTFPVALDWFDISGSSLLR
ncbi:MAG: hypothetical protein ABSD89_09325 [Halobacteriota archaeon]